MVNATEPNNAVEGWNSKLSKLTGKNAPHVYLVVQTLIAVSEKKRIF